MTSYFIEAVSVSYTHLVTRREFESGVTYLQLMEQNVENLRLSLIHI